MTTVEQQVLVPEGPSENRQLPLWAGGLVVLLAVAVGVGIGFLAFGRDSSTSSAVDPEVEQLLDDFWAAWNAYDADAIRALSTADAVVSDRDLTATGATSLETKVSEYRTDGLSFERVGDPVVRDVGPHIDVVQVSRGTYSAGNVEEDIDILRLVRQDGTLKVEWLKTYDYVPWRGRLS